MKFPLNRIRPYLPEWLSFLQQEENAPERKTIDAKKLEKICELISPSLSHCSHILQSHSDEQHIFHMRNLVTQTFLYNYWDTEDRACPDYWQDLNTSDLQAAKKMIAELELSGNIILDLRKYPGDDSIDINKIEIKNLNIEGDFGAELNHIREIEFTNNIFQKSATIRVIGTPQCRKCTFRNNQFSDLFLHPIFNVDSINFIDNIFSHQADLHFAPPLMNELYKNRNSHADDEEYNKEFSNLTRNFQMVESNLAFTKNQALILSIHDHKDLATPYKNNALPFKKIEFLGGNAFDYLKIETHHSALNSYSSMRADVNKIFFDVSDEISPLVRTGNGTYSTDGFDSQARKHQLSYLEFFSLLKKDAAKQHTPVLEDIYAKKIRYFSRVLVSRWQDKFIFHWGNWISDGGESWTKPLGWFLLFQFIFSCIAWLSAWLSELPVSFGALLFEFLNPLSSFPSLESSKTSAWTAFLLLFHKLVAAVTIYEAIKALRRFTK